MFPARIASANPQPVRSAESVCWTRSSDKHWMAYSDNVDVFLDVLEADDRVRVTYVPPLTNMQTGLPWQSGLAVCLGHHEIPYCSEVQRAVKANDRIRVRFTSSCTVSAIGGLYPYQCPTSSSRHRQPYRRDRLTTVGRFRGRLTYRFTRPAGSGRRGVLRLCPPSMLSMA